MTLRQSILSVVCCGILGGTVYGLWYKFGPEGASPDYATMRKYRLSTLSDDKLRTLIAGARKKYAGALAQERESAKKSEQEYAERNRGYDERYRAWEVATAQCHSDEVFRMKNEELCNNPPHFAMPRMSLNASRVASEEQYIEWEIMFWCDLSETVRQARENGCLPPK
jgi:hypothetical protein